MWFYNANEKRRIANLKFINSGKANVQFVKIFKYLGTIQDYILDFKNYIDYICKNTGRGWNSIYNKR